MDNLTGKDEKVYALEVPLQERSKRITKGKLIEVEIFKIQNKD